MDLNNGKLITHNIVHEIPATDVIIKAIKTMAYNQQGFKSLRFKNNMELSSTVQIGLQEQMLTAMITRKVKKKMMTKNTIMKKPTRMTQTRKNPKNKNRLILMRSAISSLMQERVTIISYI